MSAFTFENTEVHHKQHQTHQPPQVSSSRSIPISELVHIPKSSFPNSMLLLTLANHTHEQPISHRPAYNAHITNGIEHVRHLKTLRLAPLPTKSFYTYSPLPPPALELFYSTSTIPIDSGLATHLLTMHTSETASKKAVTPRLTIASRRHHYQTNVLTHFFLSAQHAVFRGLAAAPAYCLALTRSAHDICITTEISHVSYSAPFTNKTLHNTPSMIFFLNTHFYSAFFQIFSATNCEIIFLHRHFRSEVDRQPLVFRRLSLLAASHPQGMVQWYLRNACTHIFFTIYEIYKLPLLC